MKNKLKSYGFWLGILSGIGLIVKEVLALFEIAIDAVTVDQAISVALSAACVLGLVTPPPDAAEPQPVLQDATEEQPDPVGQDSEASASGEVDPDTDA